MDYPANEIAEGVSKDAAKVQLIIHNNSQSASLLSMKTIARWLIPALDCPLQRIEGDSRTFYSVRLWQLFKSTASFGSHHLTGRTARQLPAKMKNYSGMIGRSSTKQSRLMLGLHHILRYRKNIRPTNTSPD
jgi:hypothetical protein